MPQTAGLDTVAPDALADARRMAHNAAQIAALAALANIEARPDYSHTALQWEAAHGGFQTNVMATSDGPVMIRVTLSPLAMWLVRGGETVGTIDLDDTSEADCMAWLDEELIERGLKAASSVKHPFKLPKDVAAIDHFNTEGLDAGLQVLSRWYDLANHQLMNFAHRPQWPRARPPGRSGCWAAPFRHRHLCRPGSRWWRKRQGHRLRHVAGRQELWRAVFLRQPMAATGREFAPRTFRLRDSGIRKASLAPWRLPRACWKGRTWTARWLISSRARFQPAVRHSGAEFPPAPRPELRCRVGSFAGDAQRFEKADKYRIVRPYLGKDADIGSCHIDGNR